MHPRYAVGAMTGIAFICLTSAAMAQSACDQYAAHPLDKTKPPNIPGVEFSEIPVIRAVDACRTAVQQYPNEPRYAFQLGRAYHAAKEFSTARRLYARAAGKGHLLAMANLGYMMLHDQGGTGDENKGIRLLKYAAAHGVADAQFALGFAYASGFHVEKNLVLAYALFMLAKSGYPAKSQRALQKLHDRMSATELTRADALAREISSAASKALAPKRVPKTRTSEDTKVPPPKYKNAGKTGQITFAQQPSGGPLPAKEIFKKVSRAIYVIYAGALHNGNWKTTGGSAVAVSPYRLLTACHVVANANAIIAVQKGRVTAAALLTGDTNSDRCVLFTANPMPVWAKVRHYSELDIGDRVYAIGAPRNLEMTLSDGLLSSKRTLRGVRYIQTTAPISKGSSGGGLFDQWGNLIGITTLSFRNSQNLNFAIAAEDFSKEK